MQSQQSKLASTRHITGGSGSSKIVHIYIYVSAGLMCVCVYNTELFWWGERVPCREKDGPHFPTRNTHHHNDYNQDDDDSTTTSILVVEEGERELGASRSLRWRDVAVHGHVL
jgi:hypothetical protein